jgi:hypothetical protein
VVLSNKCNKKIMLILWISIQVYLITKILWSLLKLVNHHFYNKSVKKYRIITVNKVKLEVNKKQAQLLKVKDHLRNQIIPKRFKKREKQVE